MLAVKRKYLEIEEIFKFNTSNNFEIERHFSPIKMNFEKNKINLWIDHSYSVIPNSIIVEAIYFDFSKKIDKYDTFEYHELFNIPLPKEGILKHNEFSIPIKVKENTKVLWKINFKIKPKLDCDLHISLS